MWYNGKNNIFVSNERVNAMSVTKERIFRVAMIAVAVLLIVLGVLRGEPATVLTKAVNICLECVGIG